MMNQTILRFAFRFYRLLNHLPFNNKIKGTVHIDNEGTILWKCRIKSVGSGNKLIIREGGTP